MDERLEQLGQWLAGVLGGAPAFAPAADEASARRHFRVAQAGAPLVAVDAPGQAESLQRYVAIARRLRALGLNVPEVVAEDCAAGFLLVTDLGDALYRDRLDETTVERLYGDALGALVVLQAGGCAAGAEGFLPEYDAPMLRRELELFREWYLGHHLGRVLAAAQQAALDQMFDTLVRAALAQPRVWVHRDFHSRNLVVTGRNNPGILDFQDAVRGPVTYDLVSLLRDCYIGWPRDRVEDWVKGYHELALQSGLPVGADDTEFLRRADLMGVQRHLKAAGIFARLAHRDGKPRYLADIPRTLGYVREVSGRYAELAPLARLLGEIGVA